MMDTTGGVNCYWTPTGKGYWLMTDSGGINAYGDAVYYGHEDWYGEAVAFAPSPVYNKPTQAPGLE